MLKITAQIALLTTLLLFCINLNAQHYSSQKAQVKMTVNNDTCQFETVNSTVRADLDLDNKTCTFMMPVAAFQLNERTKKTAFRDSCFPLEGYPMVSFSGKLEGVEKLKKKKTATLDVRMTGELTIKGMKFPISENVMLLLENGELRWAFDTAVNVGEVMVELDCDFSMRNSDGIW